MPVFSEVHQPSATSPTSAIRYTLTPYYPSLYPPSPPTDPTDPPVEQGNGNDYTQASCTMSVTLGMAVQADSSGQSTVLQPATSSSPQPVVGIVVGRPSPAMAIVQTDGLVTLGLSGLVPGANYFVAQNGALQMPPLTGVVYAQLVGVAQSETSLYLANSGQVYGRQTEDDGENEN